MFVLVAMLGANMPEGVSPRGGVQRGLGAERPLGTPRPPALQQRLDGALTATLAVIRIVQAGGSLADLQTKAEALAAAEPEYRYDRRRAENPGGYLPETLRAVFQAS